MDADDDIDEDQVLTEAEMLSTMMTKTEEALASANAKIAALKATQEKLRNLLDTTEAPHFIPLCGGIAFYEGVIRHTNDVMVLLGDNWFAKRTVSQSVAIAGRRLDFLANEKKILEYDKQNIESRQNLLASEGLLPGGTSGRGDDDRDDAGGERKPAYPTRSSEAKAAQKHSGVVADEEAFCELDDLTVDELERLEEELGSDVENDEIVERRMFEMMDAKRRRRIDASKSAARSSAVTSSSAAPDARAQQQSAAKKVRFADPSDIGSDPKSAFSAAAPEADTIERRTTGDRVVASEVVERPAGAVAAAQVRGIGELRPVGGGVKKKSLFGQGLA